MSGAKKILHVTVVTERQTSKKSFEVDSVIVGRNPDCLLSISHHDISRKHVTLWVRGEEVWIEDLGSSNGTFINGARLVPHAPQVLFPTDKVSVGASTGISLLAELEVIAPIAPPPEEPESVVDEPLDHAETVIFAPPKKEAPAPTPVPEPEPAYEAPSFPSFEPTPSMNARSTPSPEPVIAPLSQPAPVAAKPKSPSQHIEINRLLQDAKREAEEILRMARLEAEHKVQEIYERAENTQKDAENFYHQRMQEAYRSAEEAYSDAKKEAEELLEKTRKSCDEIRRQTNTSTSDIRSRTRKECDVLLREAEAQARLLKEHRQQEAEAALARKEEQLIAEIKESMALSQKELEDRIREESRLHEERLLRERTAHEDQMAEEKSVHQEKISSEAKAQADRLTLEAQEHRERISSEITAHQQKISDESTTHEERLRSEGAEQAKRLQIESAAHEERLAAELKEHKDKLAAEATEQSDRLAKEKERFETETADLRLEHASLTQETKSLVVRKDELEISIRAHEKDNEDLVLRYKELSDKKEAVASSLEALDKEKSGLSAELDKKKRAFEELNHQYKELERKKDSASREVEAELLQLKSKLESAKVKMQKEEDEQLVYLKLETAKRVQQTEKELLSEMARKKHAFVKEIMVSLEKSSSVISSKVSDWRKETPGIEESLLSLIEGQLFAMKVDGVSAPQKIDLGAKRRKERAQHVGFGAFVGMLVLFLGIQTMNRLKGPSPLERAVASEAEARQKDLERRKFNPPKSPAWKDDYVDAVIYTDRFVELTTTDEYQKKWSLAASKHLLKLWKVDEDSSLQVVSISNALVKALAERKEKIHPDYVKDGLKKMKEAEDEAVKRMSNLLGSQVRFESLKKFEKEFFLSYRDSAQ